MFFFLYFSISEPEKQKNKGQPKNNTCLSENQTLSQ